MRQALCASPRCRRSCRAPRRLPPTPGKTPWKVELPKVGAKDDQFGGCRSIEVTYEKVKQIGEGTYGQVRPPPASPQSYLHRLLLISKTPPPPSGGP